MSDEEKRIEEEIVEEVTPSTEEVETTDTTSELPTDTEVSDKDEGKEETERTDGGEGGDVTDEVPTEQSDSSDEEKDGDGEKEEGSLDTEEEKDLPVQEDIEKTDEIVEDTPPIPPIDVEALQREVEELKYEKETNTLISGFQELVVQQQQKYDELNAIVEDAVLKEFDKYGISTDMDLDNLAVTDPSKYQIFRNIMVNAKNFKDQETQKLQEPIKKASEDIVFRVAGKEMQNYELSEGQVKEAAKTFVTIMNEYGIKDLKEDLKAKVEVAVAKAKMVIKDVVKPEETVKPEEVKEEPKKEVKKEGKKLEDFTKGVSPGIPPKGASVNKDNVMALYTSKQGKDRLAFFAQHKDLIMEQLSKQGMGYSDNTRRW